MHSHSKLSLFLFCLTPLLAQQQPSQEKPPNITTDYSDPLHPKTMVVVTATRTDDQVEKSAVSLSLVTRQELETRPVKMIDQSLTVVPGVFVRRSKGPADSTTTVQMRGFSGANRTLVLLDGQPLNDAYSGRVNWSALPVDEVENVEVLRGPFSSLYGGMALGGVVNIVTRLPERRAMEVGAEYGSFDTLRYTARYTDRLFNRLGISLGYQRLDFGGYRNAPALLSASSSGTGPLVTGVTPTMTNTGKPTYMVGWNGENTVNQHAYRAKGVYSIGSSTVITLQYMLTRYYWGYNASQSLLRDSTGAVVDNGTVTFLDGDVTRVLKVTPGAFLKSGPGGEYNHFWSATLQRTLSERQSLRVDAGYYNVPNYNYRTPSSSATADGGPGNRNYTIRRQVHANAQYNLSGGRHNLVAGTEAQASTATNMNYAMNNWTDPDNLVSLLYIAGGRAYNQSAYGQDQINLTDHLTVVAGGRYDYWRTYNGHSNGFSAATPSTVYPDRSKGSFTGKVALTYGLGAGLLLRASAGTAFRSPGIYEMYATQVISGITYASNPALVPEHARSWEAGVRKRLGERTSVDASYYENRVRDMIYRTSDLTVDPNGLYRVNRNAGEQRTRGVELAVDQRILSWLRFRGAYNFADAIITKNPAVPATVGKRALYIPRNSASGQLLGSRGRWTGSLTARYAGETFNSDLNTDATRGVYTSYDPYFVVDANLGCRLSRRFEVYVSGDNLLNRRYHLYYLAPGRSATGGIRIRL